MMAVTNLPNSIFTHAAHNSILLWIKPCAGVLSCCGRLVLVAITRRQRRVFSCHVHKDQIMNKLVYLLEPFLHREYRRVKKHLNKARKKKLPATLSLTQWLTICREYDYKCAYCERGRLESLDHVLPLSLGGGTTAKNCVPCCEACNFENNEVTREVTRRIEVTRERLAALKMEVMV